MRVPASLAIPLAVAAWLGGAAQPARAGSLSVPARYTKLENGLKVVLSPDATAATAVVAVYYNIGFRIEPKDRTGFAHLFEHMMFQGSANLGKMEFIRLVQRNGGLLNGSTRFDFTNYFQIVPPHTVETILWAEADRMRGLAITQDNLTNQQGVVKNEVKVNHEAKFSAARSRLYVVGRFDAAAVERAAREAFGGWKAGIAAEPLRAKPASTRAVYLVDKPGAVQSTLIVGVPVIDPSHPDWVPLSVTNTLLGGYFSSRVTTNIRESKGYTYSPFSAITPHPGDAYWAQQADVTTAVTGASLKEIFSEIDRLQAEPPPEAELDAVKSYQAGTFVFQNSQRGGITSQLQFLDQYGLPDDYLTGYVRRVRAVQPAKVQEMAAKYIDDAKAAIVVGDRKIVESQVREFGPLK
jgi:predicted Zn-dependent peptidase